MDAPMATLEMVERIVGALAMSAAFPVEVQLAAAQVIAPLPVIFYDANGAMIRLQLAETQFPDMSWVSTGFTRALVSASIRLEAPYPFVRVAGKSLPYQTAKSGDVFRNKDVVGQRYGLDVDVFTSRDLPEYAQREAIILSRALESLIRRNETLSNYVQVIQPMGSIQPGGSASVGPGVVAAARQSYEVLTLSE